MKKKRVDNKPLASLPEKNPVEPARADISDRPRSPVNGQPVPPPQWAPGQSGNPGGAPKGKRISTWLAHFGDMTAEDLAAWEKYPGLTVNARIALAQLRRATDAIDGLPAAAWAADRVEGGVDRTVHLTHKQEPTMSPDEAAKIIKASEDARKLGEF